MTYDAVGQLIGLGPMMLGEPLDKILKYCHKKDLPPLTVLVVKKKSGKPADGYEPQESIDKDRERVFKVNWYELEPPQAEDFS